MDQITKDFSLVGLASLAVMIVVTVGVTRRLVTFFVPSLVPMKISEPALKTYIVTYRSSVAEFYNEIGLYLLPYMWAAWFALATNEFLYGNVKTYVGRLFLSFLVATFSATIFKAVKKSLPSTLGVVLEGAECAFIEDKEGTVVVQSKDIRENKPTERPSKVT